MTARSTQDEVVYELAAVRRSPPRIGSQTLARLIGGGGLALGGVGLWVAWPIIWHSEAAWAAAIAGSLALLIGAPFAEFWEELVPELLFEPPTFQMRLSQQGWSWRWGQENWVSGVDLPVLVGNELRMGEQGPVMGYVVEDENLAYELGQITDVVQNGTSIRQIQRVLDKDQGDDVDEERPDLEFEFDGWSMLVGEPRVDTGLEGFGVAVMLTGPLVFPALFLATGFPMMAVLLLAPGTACAGIGVAMFLAAISLFLWLERPWAAIGEPYQVRCTATHLQFAEHSILLERLRLSTRSDRFGNVTLWATDAITDQEWPVCTDTPRVVHWLDKHLSRLTREVSLRSDDLKHEPPETLKKLMKGLKQKQQS